MTMSRLVSTSAWRYAVGEVVLIVVGVTIALAATSWYEGRQQRRDEVALLQQLRRTLAEDLQDIDMEWEITQQREHHLTDLLHHLESGQPYTAELGVKFQALLGWRTSQIKTAPFETLKAESYSLISGEKLREKLMSFYEDRYRRLLNNLGLDRDFVIEKVQPYYLENFVMRVADERDVDGGMQAWVPKDYERIQGEGYIANLCRFRADLLRRFALRDYEETTALMRDILQNLDEELGTPN